MKGYVVTVSAAALVASSLALAAPQAQDAGAAAFYGNQSVQKPARYDEPAASANARLSAMRDAVHRIVDLTGIAGLTSLPQVNIPAGSASGIPVGLSLIGWRGGDAALVGAACALAEAVSACPFEQAN